jgi:aspartyl-tRNA(Asn)/glutamyl-tRNA(Gln) amidotransferase subunit A
MKVRAMVASQFREALQSVDVLLTPTCLSLPNKTETDADPTGMFANDVLTVPISLASLPAISIPWQEGSPVGLQIVGCDDDKVLEVAATLEQLRMPK